MHFFIFALFFLAACSGLEQSEREKLRRHNAKGEFIYRKSDEFFYSIENPAQHLREKYPWENGSLSDMPRITKDYFRCKGNSVHTPRPAGDQNYFDCNGRHSLPLQNKKEFIYPILIDLLNYIQAQTKKRVIITTGYRCPTHNTYCDSTSFNQTSKHMIGAEVDFYVRGMEHRPEEIVKLIIQYYRGKKEFEQFLRYDKGDTNVSIQPWYNKEILIKLFKKEEGRDEDNCHTYPYLSLQVRFDRQRNEKITYSSPKAQSCYLRY